MRALKIIEHVSLDGVVQHTEDGTGFPYSGWNGPYRTPEGRDVVAAAHGETFDLLLGRRTYDLWAEFWPTAPSSPIGDRINAATKYVVTHRSESLTWGPCEAVGPDFVEGVRRIKAADGPGLVLSGSSTLTSTLLEQRLVDELLLVVYPVLLGTGKRVLERGFGAHTFLPGSSTTTPSGVTLTSYQPAGQLHAG